jgi:hypothetical protein
MAWKEALVRTQAGSPGREKARESRRGKARGTQERGKAMGMEAEMAQERGMETEMA